MSLREVADQFPIDLLCQFRGFASLESFYDYHFSSQKYAEIRHVWGEIHTQSQEVFMFTRSPMVARWSLSIIHSVIQSYVVARSGRG